jgi:hypothetical protein
MPEHAAVLAVGRALQPDLSCFLMTFGISWSSTFFRSAALIWPLSRFARASVIAAERR